MATFVQLAASGVVYDALGDRITNEKQTDRSLPHNSGLRCLYQATQASASHSVVLGDKENPETTEIYNVGCIVDLAEAGMGHGGGDLTLEFKAYNDLVPAAGSAEYETTYRGDTHAFGNSEERLIRKVRGVRARGTASDRVWDPSKGEGRVAAHAGDYDDAVRVKRNTLILFLINLYGGLTPEAVKHVYALKERAKALDRTEYPRRGATKHQSFVEYWTQRLSAPVVTADARRCIKRLPGLRAKALNAIRGAAERRAAATRA
jgi:hypothetical protein